MCNELNNGNKIYTIPASGYGYKIFALNTTPGGRLRPYFKADSFPINKWILWKEESLGVGFCFFRSLKEVRHFHKLTEIVGKLYKIQYKQGLGKRGEPLFYCDTGFMSSLCKEFKILEEVK